MAALYGNENVSLRLVEALRTLGHDVLTSKEAGNANQGIPDRQMLAYAFDAGRIVLTNNRKDFIRLYRSDASHGGILIYKVDPDVVGLAKRIHAALSEADAQGRFLLRVALAGHSFDP